jgi:hypothetical protein
MRFVLVFFVDILDYSSNLEEHLDHLRTVLGVLHAHQLYAKGLKCRFGVPKIDYLGHFNLKSGGAGKHF